MPPMVGRPMLVEWTLPRHNLARLPSSPSIVWPHGLPSRPGLGSQLTTSVRTEKRDAGNLGYLELTPYGKGRAGLEPVRSLDDLGERAIAIVEIREGAGGLVRANSVREGLGRLCSNARRLGRGS